MKIVGGNTKEGIRSVSWKNSHVGFCMYPIKWCNSIFKGFCFG